MEPVRWGVLGAAKFAHEQMAPAIHMADGADFAAIATSDAAKAVPFQAFQPLEHPQLTGLSHPMNR